MLHAQMRPDLVIAAQGLPEERYWLVEDPVTLKYFRLRDEEYSILRMLDGQTALEQVKEQFESRFAPLRLSARQLQGFLYRLHELGLIVRAVPGQGSVLRKRNQNEARQAWLARLLNPLAIRLPGIPAAAFIDWLYPRVRWMFSPLAVVLWVGLLAAAVALILLEFATFQARLPSFGQFFGARSAALFVVALIGVKALHELGHALMCRHFGAPCREIGVMLLVFAPTLYCDVSDAWSIRSKWQRMLVSAAGMLVELVIAASATLVWWFSDEGVLHDLALRVMFLCSVSTLLFNANPLLRCDGYYILADLVDIPNLWQESRLLWRRAAWGWLTGLRLPSDPTIPERMHPWLMLYALFSTVYSWLLVGGILWFCFRVLEPAGMSWVAAALIAMVMGGLVVTPGVAVVKTLADPRQRRQIRRGRGTLTLLAGCVALSLAALAPVPHHIQAPFWLEAADAKNVYVTVPGRLQFAMAPGHTVAPGETLAVLENPETELELAALRKEVEAKELLVKHLKLLLNEDPSAAPLIPAEEKTLASLRERLTSSERDAERLRIVAPISGLMIPPPVFAPPPDSRTRRLPSWHGTPLDRQNQGAYLESGTLVCQIGQADSADAILVVDQAAIPSVRAGQRVRLRVAQAPAQILQGQITEVGKMDAEELPATLARALGLPLPQVPGAARPLPTCYQARVALDGGDAPRPPLLVGMHGQAKIVADWQPLLVRLWNYLERTFRLA